MKPKTLILAVVAVVCGLGAMWMTNRLLAEKQKEVPQGEAKEKVLVAKAKIPSQTVFKDVDKYFEEKEVAASAIPPNSLRTAEKIKGKRLSRTLAEGAYVSPEDLVSPESDGLGAVLPAGMRAVAIRVQPDSQVAGFVIPKSHVDVLCTVRGNEGSTTYTILENMEVLAIDTKSNRAAEGETAFVASTVTLAATPDDCNLLKMAAGTGTLDLLLRPIGDVASTKPKSAASKILENPKRGNREEGSDSDTALTQGNNGGLPALPGVASGQAPAPAPPVQQQAAQKDPELEVFVMTIQTGPTVERVRFTKKSGETWPVESTALPAPAATPGAAPAPGSGPAGFGPGVVPGFGPGAFGPGVAPGGPGTLPPGFGTGPAAAPAAAPENKTNQPAPRNPIGS